MNIYFSNIHCVSYFLFLEAKSVVSEKKVVYLRYIPIKNRAKRFITDKDLQL